MRLSKEMDRRRRSKAVSRPHGSLSRQSILGHLSFERLEDRRLLAVDFVALSNSLDSELSVMQSKLTLGLTTYKTGEYSTLPMIGNALGDASRIVDNFNSNLRSSLAGLGTVTNPTNSQIQQALSVLPNLVDRNGNGVGPDDVLIGRNAAWGSEGFSVQMRLFGELEDRTDIGFNTGLPGVPLDIATGGEVVLSVGYAFELAFVYRSTNATVSLDSNTTLAGYNPPSGQPQIVDAQHPLAIFVTAGLSEDFNASATLGFVHGSMTAIQGRPNQLRLAVMANALTGTTPTLKVDGSADVNLRLAGSFAETANDFPGIDADFKLHWSFTSQNATANPPELEIDNVYLNVGRFLSNVVAPVFSSIKFVTAPIRPVLEVLGTPLPGVSDLSRLAGGDNISLLDLGAIVAPYTPYGPLYDLAHKLTSAIDLISNSEIGDSVRIPLGGFDLNTFDLRNSPPARDINDLTLKSITDFALTAENLRLMGRAFDELVSELDLPTDMKDLLLDFSAPIRNGLSVKFPILDRPQDAVFHLLLGQDSDLFTLEAEAHVSASGPFMPSLWFLGVEIGFNGEVDVDTRFKYGYDTYGLRSLIKNLAQGNTSSVLEDILSGYYIDSGSYFNMGGQMSAGVGARFGVFSAVVGGFISTANAGDTPASITLVDPNNDGKLRKAEVGPDSFQLGGLLEAALGIEVRVGVDVLGKFVGWKKRFDIASTIIVNLNTPGPNDPPRPEPGSVILASQPDEFGTVELYIGQLAGSRSGLGVNTTNGNERLIIRNLDSDGETESIEIAMRERMPIIGTEYWVTQVIPNVKKIVGYGDLGDLNIDVLPGVNVDVHLAGGLGRAELHYNGSGEARLSAGQGDSYLVGGSGFNQLLGSDGDDTLVLGPSGNFVGGGGGNNTIIISTPYADAGLIVGGNDPTADNTIVVISSDDTAKIQAVPGSPGSIGLSYQLAGEAFSPTLTLRQFSTLVISAQDFDTEISVGDMSPAGVSTVIVNIPTAGIGTGRQVHLDMHAAGLPSQVAVSPFLHVFPDPTNPTLLVQNDEILVTNSTTGVTTYLLGMGANDVTTVQQHGGLLQIGQLATDTGTWLFDFSGRSVGVGQNVTLTTPSVAAGNNIRTDADNLDRFVIQAQDLPKLVFQGLAASDSIAMNVSAPGFAGAANIIDLDASAMHGALFVSALGGVTARNEVTLRSASEDAYVHILGGATTSALRLGTGRLADIQQHVTATNVQLTVDNAQATMASLLTLSASNFGRWSVPGNALGAGLNFTGLRGHLEVFAGAGDQFQLDVTPVGVTGMTMHNGTTSIDRVYTANWSVPLALNGNFAFYAGQRLRSNGTVERIKRLTDVGVPVTLDFQGTTPTEVVLDGELDPPGSQYSIGGQGDIYVTNHTVGLDVAITGFRSTDDVRLFMTGATLSANLQRTSPGTFHFDGTGRLHGINESAANSVVIDSRYGNTEMLPVGEFGSHLNMFNDVYLLGSTPQDALTLNIPTNVRIAMAEPTTFNISPMLDGGDTYEVYPARSDAVVMWKEGERLWPNYPQSNHFILPWPAENEWYDHWHSNNAYPIGRFPSPFDLPYGISGYVDEPITVVHKRSVWQVNAYQVIETVLPGIARYFLVDPTPTATDNLIQLDASQLRGSFHFNITGLDYNHLRNLHFDSLGIFDPTISYNNHGHGQGQVASAGGLYNSRYAFGRSEIVLSGVHEQLTVNIDSQNRTFAYSNTFNTGNNIDWQGQIVTDYPGTALSLGNGSLADIRGDISVSHVWLREVDNRLGTQPGILALNPTSLSWTTGAGNPVNLAIGQLYGELTLTGSPFDRFAIEGTPKSAWKTTVQNFGTIESPAGVYVMSKTVMPLEVRGNLELYVGHRLHSDGTVTEVGRVAGVFDRMDQFIIPASPPASNQVVVYNHNLQNVFGDFEILLPTWIRYQDGDYRTTNATTGQRVLPIYYYYSGGHQGKLVFDASSETVNGITNDDKSVTGQTMHGIAPHQFYPDIATLRYFTASVVYDTADIHFYAPRVEQGTSYRNPAPAFLIDNSLSSAVHYFANAATTGTNVVEEVLIGHALGPVHVQGNGRATRVELNPLFSFPREYAVSGNRPSLPGWGRGLSGGLSLFDTVQADVSVSNAAFRIISDIPLPSGWQAPGGRPDVVLSGSQLTGVASGTIHFSNLVNSISLSVGSGYLDLNSQHANYLPGLSLQLPAHAPVATSVVDTPANMTTVISTRLSASESTFSAGPIQVLGTTGPLVLGQLFGPAVSGSGVNFSLYPIVSGQPIGSLWWGDGLSVPQVSLGDQGSLLNIHGPVMLSGDTRTSSPLVTIIDGRHDPSRPDVRFTAQSYSIPPQSIISAGNNNGASKFFQQVDGLAPAPIYFGDYFQRVRNLQIFGSGGSSYSVVGGDSSLKVGAPAGVQLYTGADGSVVVDALHVGPMTLTGATSVSLVLAFDGRPTGYVGPPQIRLLQDAANPQPIQLQLNRRTAGSATPAGTLRLANAGNEELSLSLANFYWFVYFPALFTNVEVNYGTGNNAVMVSDTTALGTTLSAGTGTVDVLGTTGPLRINGTGTTNGNTVRLGHLSPLQAILGDVEIHSNASAPLGFTILTMDNSADTAPRNVNLTTDDQGALRITGVTPGLVKLVGERFTTTLTGGLGASSYRVASPIFPQTSRLLTLVAGSINDVLQGPDLPTTWTIDGANSVRLGANVRVNNIRNLLGGMADDLFRFTTSTSTHVIAGNLNGGGGFNTLEYLTVPNPFVTDLVGGIAPRIGNLVSNIHTVIPEHLTFIAPSFISSYDGDAISQQLTASSTVGGILNFGATGLPNGLSIDPASGLISGSIADGAYVGVTVSYQVTVTVSNGSNSRLRTFSWEVIGTTLPNISSIVGRHVFYSGSPWASGGLADALDAGKTLAKEGNEPLTLTYDNLINSSRGINGLVFDIQNLPGGSSANLTVADFEFQMSPTGAFIEANHPPANWTTAPTPSSISVVVGTQSSPDRVVIEWPDNAIANRWLRITIKATANTGLPELEVYYIGHLLGETTGPTGGIYTVSFADIAPIRSSVGQSVDASSIFDIDKSGLVTFADISSMRPQVGTQLTNITIPAGSASNAEIAGASVPGEAWNIGQPGSASVVSLKTMPDLQEPTAWMPTIWPESNQPVVGMPIASVGVVSEKLLEYRSARALPLTLLAEQRELPGGLDSVSRRMQPVIEQSLHEHFDHLGWATELDSLLDDPAILKHWAGV